MRTHPNLLELEKLQAGQFEVAGNMWVRGLVGLVGLWGVVCPSTASSEMIRRETLAYQNWSGAAVYADSTFSHCILSFEHPGGIYLGFVLANSQYSLRMWNKGWNLAAQSSYPVTLSIDNSWSQAFRARVIGTEQNVSTVVSIPLGMDERIVDNIRRGRLLTVQTAQATFTFSLAGSSGALAALQSCYSRHGANEAVVKGNPFAPPATSPNPFAPAQRPADSQPASGKSGLNYVLAKPELRPDQLQTFLRRLPDGEYIEVKSPQSSKLSSTHYAYVGSDIRGFYWEEQTAQRDPMSLIPRWISVVQATCKGQFVSGTQSPIKNGRRLVHSGFWACSEAKEKNYGYITALDGGATAGFYLTMPAMPDSDAAKDIDGQIRNALVEIIRGP